MTQGPPIGIREIDWYRGCGYCKPNRLGKYAQVEVPKRIITINMPLIYQDALMKLVNMGLFNSLSQVIRICLKKFLDRELNFKADLKENPSYRKKTIMTVNIPKEFVKIIGDEFVDQFVGAEPLYPSRSELVRVAIRDFLMEIYNEKMTDPELKPDPNIIVDNDNKIWNIGRAI